MIRFRGFPTAPLTLLACLALTPLAYAQNEAPKPTAAQVQQAKRDVTDAAKLMKKKEYAEALPKLQAAYAIDPKPATLAQIGTCQRELSHYAESYATFEQLLAADKVSSKDKAFAQKNLDEIAKATGTLRVTVSEPAADVTLDGKAVAAEALANPIRLAPGTHKLSVRKEGFEPLTVDLDVQAGAEASFDAKLVAEVKTARVSVAEANGQAVHVFVDGKNMGAAPWEGELQPGKHTIELKGDNLVSPPQTIDVAAKQQLTMQLEAAPTSPIAAAGEQPTNEDPTVAAQPAVEEESSGRFVKPGVLLGIGLPRIANGEVVVKLGDYFAIGGQYAMIPTITFPGLDAKLGTSTIQGTLRTFPFGGAFYLGVNGGVQMLDASMSEGDLTVKTKMSAPVIAPQIGWLWMWDSGFALGINAGVQIPFAKEPEIDVEYGGVNVASAAGHLPAEKVEKANDMKKTVTDAAKLIGKTPFPQIDLIKIGFFF